MKLFRNSLPLVWDDRLFFSQGASVKGFSLGSTTSNNPQLGTGDEGPTFLEPKGEFGVNAIWGSTPCGVRAVWGAWAVSRSEFYKVSSAFLVVKEML